MPVVPVQQPLDAGGPQLLQQQTTQHIKPHPALLPS